MDEVEESGRGWKRVEEGGRGWKRVEEGGRACLDQVKRVEEGVYAAGGRGWNRVCEGCVDEVEESGRRCGRDRKGRRKCVKVEEGIWSKWKRVEEGLGGRGGRGLNSTSTSRPLPTL